MVEHKENSEKYLRLPLEKGELGKDFRVRGDREILWIFHLRSSPSPWSSPAVGRGNIV